MVIAKVLPIKIDRRTHDPEVNIGRATVLGTVEYHRSDLSHHPLVTKLPETNPLPWVEKPHDPVTFDLLAFDGLEMVHIVIIKLEQLLQCWKFDSR